MITETNIAPQNSLLLVMDRDSGVVPQSMGGKLVAATPSCVAVGTLSAADGETWVLLTDEKDRTREIPGLRMVYSGVLATPQSEVHVCTVLNRTVLKLDVPDIQSNVEIWVNH